MLIKQINVFVENRPGRLYESTRSLATAGVSIRALSIADTTDFGILRLICSDPESAAEALKKDGFTVSVTWVLAVSMEDKPGALADVMKILTEAGIAVEYAYAFIGGRPGGAYVIIRVEDNEKAAAALEKGGVVLLDSDAVYNG